MDLICEIPQAYNSIGSFYFFGYAIGIIFFFLPDLLGRRKTMCIFYPLNILSCYIAIYSGTIFWKKVGFFLIGLFHVKLSLSQTYALELMPFGSKNIAITVMLAFDASNLMLACLILKYVTVNMESVLTMYFYMTIVALILFLAFIPESPKWLFMKKGRNNQEGIRILNYIS